MTVGALVVDANVVFGALLRDGTNRGLILHGNLDLHSPDAVWGELDRNRDFLCRKAHASGAAFDLLVAGMRSRIRTIPREALQPWRDEALRRVGKRDRLDAPYVAAALAIGAGIWSHDKQLAKVAGVPVWTTAEILAATSGE